MARKRTRYDLAIVLASIIISSAAQNAAALSGSIGVRSVRDAYALMYREQALFGGAYLLLNATASVGSASGGPESAEADAPLVHLRHLPRGGGNGGGGSGSDNGGPWAVLVPAAEANAFLEELARDDALAARVAAVLVDDTDAPPAHSSLPPFPGAEFAPYKAPSYVWNPAGTGVATRRWNVPVMRLSPERAADARERANYNAAGAVGGAGGAGAAATARQRKGRAEYRARVRMRMSSAGAANATACLEAGACAPLGGYSVWAAWPPLAPGANATLPTTLVVAQVDAFDIFHDSIQGANAPVSGLVAMLAAARLLSDGTSGSGGCDAASPTRSLLGGGASGSKRQIVFVALAGEPWGYMGSKALLWELEQRTANVEGLDWSLVDQVLEISPVGLSLPSPASKGGSSNGSSNGSSGAAVLFAHTQRGDGFGDAAPLVAALQKAAEAEAAGAGSGGGLAVDVRAASADNPGIPPSSLMSFLRAKPSVAGAVLAEFDRAWINPYQGGRFDTASRVDTEAVARAAALVARTLHSIACGDGGAGASAGQSLPVNATAARELARGYFECFTTATPGLSCAAAAPLIDAGYTEDTATGARSYAAQHYVGVLQFMFADAQTPALKSDATRFIWGLLASATAARGGGGDGKGNASSAAAGAACDPYKTPCPPGQVCVGFKPSRGRDAAAGTCARATVKYVPSLSTRVRCADCGGDAFAWRVTNASDAWAAAAGWPDDPEWVESNWPAGEPFLQLYLLKPWRARVVVLVAGVVLTVAALAGALAARHALDVKLKSS